MSRAALRAITVSLLLAGVAARAQTVAPYELLGFKVLNNVDNPFHYWIDSRGLNPSTVALSAEQGEVEAAYATWQAVSCASPVFADRGFTSTNSNIVDPRDPYDRFNVTAVWITDKNDPYYTYALGGGAAAASDIPLSYGGILYQCDIYLNAVDFTWSTISPTPAAALDLQSFILHEIGHCLGLGHSSQDGDVMYPDLEPGTQLRKLSTRDVGVLCLLYPQSGAVGSPCDSSGNCSGSGYKCVNPPAPDGGSFPRYCTHGCDPAQGFQCDEPFVCKQSTLISGSPGACLAPVGDYVTQVGHECSTDPDCGSAVGLCQTQGSLPSGFPAWQDGYCLQQCGTGFAPCPAQSTCIDLGSSKECLKTCRLGFGDCRPGYTCSQVTDTDNVCVSACHSDEDCGAPTSGQTCRLCDGTCVAIQTASAQIGDPCTASSQCGPGQVCITFEGQTSGVCSSSCASACTACPSGSTCHVVSSGDLYCLRDCVTGSCSAGQQCGLLSDGRACIPACRQDSECPVGTHCYSGQCSPTGSDGGCALCTKPKDGGISLTQDAGTQPKPPSGSGCGCGATPGLSLPLSLLALWRRRRSSR